VATAATSLTVSGYTGNWTNGDATCDTEYNEKVGSGGTFALISTEAAGATSKARTGLVSHTSYFYKLDHIKSGIRSSDSNVIEAKTLLGVPVASLVDTGGGSFALHIDIADSGVTLYVQQSPDGVGSWTEWATVSSATAGTYIYAIPPTLFFRAYTEDLAWSVTTSTPSNVVGY
jgi:hypothetical protein